MSSTRSLRSALLIPVLLLPTFMGFLDLWIMLVALPSIRAELHASAGAAQLMVGLYLTTYGAFLVLGGRLGDTYGRRRMLLTGVFVFTASSALCMVAPDATTLIVARALQGIGAALMLPQVLSIIQVAVPADRRTAAIGAYSSVIGIAIVSGLMLGGALLQADLFDYGWRMLFAIKIPLGLVIMPLIKWVVPESTVADRRRLDVKGVALLSTALVVGLLSLEEGSDRGWSTLPIVGILVGVVVGACFVWTELHLESRGGDPLVSPHLLREAPVRFGLVVTVLFYIATSGLFVVLPFLFQDALGLDPLETGLAFAPLGVAFAGASLAGRRPDAPTGTLPMIAGAGVMFVGLGLATIAVWQGGGTVLIAAPLAIFGCGAGMVFPQIVSTVLARVASKDAGAASGVLLTATQASNALGVAIVGGVFTGAAGLGTRDAFAVAALVALAFSLLVGVISALFARNGRVLAFRDAREDHARAGRRSSVTGQGLSDG